VAILAKARIVGVEPTTGNVLWRQALPTQGLCYKIADPLFHGDRFLITASYGNFCALFQLSDGQVRQVWQKDSLFSKFLNPVLVDGHAVCGHRERTLRCVEMATGEVKWEESFAGNILLVEGLGLILTTAGDLLLADIGPKGYREITRAQVLTGKCWTPPALAAGRLYCRNARGDVACVELPAVEGE
jgi:outer membrane protein assembly factor BamB